MAYVMYSHLISVLLVVSAAIMSEAKSFDTNFVELDTSKMIKTGESNYAILHTGFPSNWKTVSVNDDEITISAVDKSLIKKKTSNLSGPEKEALDTIKAKLDTIVKAGPFNAPPHNGIAKLTTYDRNGGVSSSSSGGAGGSSSSSSSAGGSGDGTSIQMSGKDNFVVSKKNFPNKWVRVFVNGDINTVVNKDGKVKMLPLDLFSSDDKKELVKIAQEVESSSKESEKLAKSITQSMGSPMDFIGKTFSGIFGR